MTTNITTAAPGTTVLTIATSVPATYDPALTEPALYRVASNRAFHALVTRAGTAATTNDMFVSAGAAVFLRVNAGEKISVVQAAGEADGSVWLTAQREE